MYGIRYKGSLTRSPWCLKSKDHNNYSTREDNYWQFYGISISHLPWVCTISIPVMNIRISIRTSTKLIICWDKLYVYYIYRKYTSLTDLMINPYQYIKTRYILYLRVCVIFLNTICNSYNYITNHKTLGSLLILYKVLNITQTF